MNKLIGEITNIIFDEKEKINDGNYLLLMNKLKEVNDEFSKIIKDESLMDNKDKNIEGVIWSWICGNKNSTSNDSFRTENGELFSYNLLIGYNENNVRFLKNYMANGLGYVSMTTSRHISRIKRYIDVNNIDINLINED